MQQNNANLPSVPKFEPYEDINTLPERWRVWKRNFQYYIDSQIGLNDRQKVARLLHQAGTDVQDIYENLQETSAEGNNDFEKCLNRLNSYFDPGVNTNYERQKFRNIKREGNESMDQFITNLRRQARYCGFHEVDEAIKDQIIEKCEDLNLKRKFLKKGKDLTIAKILELSRLSEMERLICSDSTTKVEVGENADINKINNSISICYRCGRRGHMARSNECSAINEKCNKCGLKGHFAKCCKTKTSLYKEKKDGVIHNSKKKKRVVKYIVETCSDDSSGDNSDCEYNDSASESINSVFAVKAGDDKRFDITVDNKVSCPFIIDSGASINIIDRHTFSKLLQSNSSYNLITNSQKFCTYGGSEVPNLGFFRSTLYSPDTKLKVKANILVFKGCGPSLLSRQTSIELGLLRVGPVEINSAMLCTQSMTKEVINKEYPNIFKGIGKLKKFKLKIPIDPNVKLIAQPVRRQPFHVRDIEQTLIKELLDDDIIEPVTGPTPCVSPSHIVRKKEKGQYRLVIDMRKANEAVMRERVPLPTFEELLADLNGCKYFSTIDLKSGYHQLELDEESRGITVFSSSLGLFRYKRLFFGIRCASEMFQRIIAHLLQGIEGVANSQDDIRIGGRTKEEHDARLKQVLDRLHENGITLNEKKCSFGVTETTFLGHHISDKGIRPTTTNQQVVKDFRTPQNKAEVRSFLGLANFSARFIPNFSMITEPLRQLTKKETDFIWNNEHEKAFQRLKELIASAPVLGYYDKEAETTLVTDASPVGIAAVLIQHQSIKGKFQPIVIKYISKALSPTEQRYSQTEKEALAIVWACESLYMYLIGKQFNIISDHKPLEVIYSPNSKPSARIQRWVLRLQPFTYKVIYKPGKSNIADAISRLLDTSSKSIKTTEDEEDKCLLALIETTIEAVTMEEIRQATLKDEELICLKEAIEKDVWSKDLRNYELIKAELCVVGEIILRGTRLVIPKQLVPRILDIGHEGHLSTNSMKSKLRCKVWWKGMDRDIEYWNDTCEGCRLVRQNSHPEPIIPTELPSRVWQQVAIDYLGPLPSGHYLLFIIDYYSRYFEVEILKQQTADVTIQALEKIICREGIMEEIICDNGPAFRDHKFREFLKSNGIKLRHTTPLWPQANGEVERQNRNVLRRLRIAQASKLDWKKELMIYLSAYRTTPHSTTGLPPGNVFRGRNIRTKIPEITQSLNWEDEEMRDIDRLKKDNYKQYADKRRHAKGSEIQLGDKVLVRQRKENKLSTPFSPTKHTVIWKNGNSIAAQSPEGKVIRRNSSYFQPIKERDLRRFDINREEVHNEVQDKNESLPVMTDNSMTKTLAKEPETMTDTLPKRQRQTPAKYKDFVLNLILDY